MEEKVLVNIERSPVFLIFMLLLAAALCISGYLILERLHLSGFFLLIPGVILLFQSLWYILTPFAEVYKNRFEIRQSWFHQKERFFNDLTALSENSHGELTITYTDGEREKIHLFGIRKKHLNLLKESFRKQIAVHAATRI